VNPSGCDLQLLNVVLLKEVSEVGDDSCQAVWTLSSCSSVRNDVAATPGRSRLLDRLPWGSYVG
jgi:hypothetical protein